MKLQTGLEGMEHATWGVVIPAKPQSAAKSRLRSLGQVPTAELVAAMFEDTLSALGQSQVVCAGAIDVVTDDETLAAIADAYGVRTASDPGRGLNEALEEGLRTLQPGLTNVALVAADLPCLTGTLVDRTLRQAKASDAAVVPDAEGVGSAMLLHRVGWRGEPQFGLL